MTVAEEKAAGRSEHRGETYYFCGTSCLAKFKADPEHYLAPQDVTTQASPGAGSQSVEYTCPMHPEVRQMGPGTCPKCGMALEPAMISAEPEDNPELRDMARRFWVSVVLTFPLLLVAMADLIPGHPFARLASTRVLTLVEMIVATPVVLWGGWPFFVRGWQSLLNRSPNMFTLIGLGVAVAYAYSVVAALAPGIFLETFRDQDGAVFVYFEAAAVIVSLVLLGQVLELNARSKTGTAIRALLPLGRKVALYGQSLPVIRLG